MKKLVPDPPPILCIKPGLTHDQAIRLADEHLNSALCALSKLPLQSRPRDQASLEGAEIELRIGQALLKVAQAETTVSVPVL
ncbi:hypothetical protein [Pseudomonas japonica]|uniref:Uncharacterized protein n=1 Tax=Pseudomonas japonica TaxID=256466 RepID=A0A239G358_9PSED|nr:hypothetical protein [Pseudomonas japonica]SNS63148.1 hypothetical protein SAMN05444352_111111 [Pseudomonas japonica]